MKAGSSPMEVVPTAPATHELPPEELVRGLRRADPKMAAQTWDRYAPMVRRVLRRTLGPQHEVEGPRMMRV